MLEKKWEEVKTSTLWVPISIPYQPLQTIAITVWYEYPYIHITPIYKSSYQYQQSQVLIKSKKKQIQIQYICGRDWHCENNPSQIKTIRTQIDRTNHFSCSVRCVLNHGRPSSSLSDWLSLNSGAGGLKPARRSRWRWGGAGGRRALAKCQPCQR